MIKRPGTITVLSATCLLFSACEKVIEPKDLPEQDPRIVLNCVIYNDSAIQASVSSSKSILSGKEYKYLENAVCHLYEDDQFIERLSGGTKGKYVSDKIAATNKKYTLKVEAPGFESVEGSTTLPGKTVLSRFQRYDTLNYDFYEFTYNMGGTGFYSNIGGSVKYKVWISDDIQATNYYSVRPVAVFRDSTGNEMDVEFQTYITNHIRSGSGAGYYYGSSAETDDKILVNGNEIMMDLEIGLNSNSTGNSGIHSVQLLLVVSNISEELYKYKYTLNQQGSTGASIFAEPVLVYNNVKNGMGIVGSANSNIVPLHNATIKKR